MTSREGKFTDVSENGVVIGFVLGPAGDGLWYGYRDYANKPGSAFIGSFNSESAAIKAVEKARA